MKIVKDRMVKEHIPLVQCQKGDQVSVSYHHVGGWKNLSDIILEKIKPIPKGKVQIKYRALYFSGGTIQKIDLPDTIIVQRKRKANSSDGTVVKKCVAEILS